MSGNDIVKYMTQEIMKYMQLPKDEREQRKSQRKNEKVNRSNRYFGMLPTAFKMFWNGKRKEK
ncbi:YqzE-like protein [Salinibacillus kushneri]|uniref:YqzE-like protein n=1 Tax=Salinibacillus kushneri TaxID=237682 RepID=A0A1I0FW46_9BACI|nr:YqzE family protein [Salinibacillus kushneri]SET61888.1 YqzE-like protein [Salinibacillus kushneri]